ncbi:MAG: hypothetical protein COA49_10195 [Bacteroidetes bacterium]|nr:MAG: hypothetical protein COA49_10195 [Bacteroidota bacterium]
MKLITTLAFALLTFILIPSTLQGQALCPSPYDGNSDGAININDLLDLLGLFGATDADADGIWDAADDCIDMSACNFTANPTTPCLYLDAIGVCGGGCAGDSDGDGICDDVDTCVGDLDECGICNGPGPSSFIIDSITILYDSVYAAVIDNWFVFEVGTDTVFTYNCDPAFVACGDLVFHEGHGYSTVQVGDQCWFSENCRYLPSVSPGSLSSTTAPHFYVYDYNGTDVATAKSTPNYNTYGVLYNYTAVMEPGICPSGWHIPSDLDWQNLELTLGMSVSGASSTGWRGTNQGSQMKATSNWPGNGNGTNSSGFAALPGGYAYSGWFYYSGFNGYWWSSSSSSSSSTWYRSLYYNYDSVFRFSSSVEYGFSARCMMD